MEKIPRRITGDDWLSVLAAEYGIAELSNLKAFLSLIDSDPDVPPKYKRESAELACVSMAALQFPWIRDASTIADIGTGYGHPGLVLACLLRAHVYMLEGIPTRQEWLQHAVSALRLANAHPVAQRVETWERRDCDVVTGKNVTTSATMVEWGAPLLRLDGRLLLWLKRFEDPDRSEALKAAEIVGLELEESQQPHHLTRDGGGLLVVLRKVRETPPTFPRPDRVAKRHPLGRPRGRKAKKDV